jgi:hypothetical protein
MTLVAVSIVLFPPSTDDLFARGWNYETGKGGVPK